MDASKRKKSEKLPPAKTTSARENQLISLAVDLAAKQLLAGSASSQVITHFLKLGTTREALEKERVVLENKLLEAKTEALQSQKDTKVLYERALKAMKIYSGNGTEEDELDD